jgi:hypothetical protein
MHVGPNKHQWGSLYLDPSHPNNAPTGTIKTYSHKCENCGLVEDVYSEGPVTFIDEVAATCTTPKYEVTYTILNNGTKSETKREAKGSALGHDWGEWTTLREATTTSEGEQERRCKRDNSHIETKAIPKKTSSGGSTTSGDNTPSGGGSTSGGKSSGGPTVSTPNKTYSINVTAKGMKNNNITIKKGKTTTIKVKGKVNGKKVKKNKIKYKSSNKKIFTITKNGKIKAKKKGTAYAIVKVNGKTRKIKVVVK